MKNVQRIEFGRRMKGLYNSPPLIVPTLLEMGFDKSYGYHTSFSSKHNVLGRDNDVHMDLQSGDFEGSRVNVEVRTIDQYDGKSLISNRVSVDYTITIDSENEDVSKRFAEKFEEKLFAGEGQLQQEVAA